MDAGLKPKQVEKIRAFKSKQFRYLMGAGTTGSGKSFVDIGLLHDLCMSIPNLRFAIIRKSEKILKRTSMATYRKVKAASKTRGQSRLSDMTAKYENGSEIEFVWADVTKDPDLDNIKGLELTGALIEEANQIDKRYFDLLKTRIGRWNNHLCPKFILLNMNPTECWCKEVFYDPFTEGTLPEGYYFSEFDSDDVQNIIDAKDSDMDADFLKDLEDLPEEEYNRFVLNKWEYSEIENQLVRYEWYRNCCLDQYHIKKTDRGLLALDPADKGKDPTEIARMHGTHIGWWEEDPKQDPGVSGLLVMARAQEYNIKNTDVVVDGVGVGTGSLTIMKDRMFMPTVFISGEKPVLESKLLTPFNKRAEAHWLFREGMRKEELTVQHHPKFQKECTKCTYSTTDRVIKIPPKDILKKSDHIGWSPGKLDCATMLYHHYKTHSGALQQELVDKQNKDKVVISNLNRLQQDRYKRIRAASI